GRERKRGDPGAPEKNQSDVRGPARTGAAESGSRPGERLRAARAADRGARGPAGGAASARGLTKKRASRVARERRYPHGHRGPPPTGGRMKGTYSGSEAAPERVLAWVEV